MVGFHFPFSQVHQPADIFVSVKQQNQFVHVPFRRKRVERAISSCSSEWCSPKKTFPRWVDVVYTGGHDEPRRSLLKL